MPELPEVETIKRQLDKTIVNLTVSSVEILNPKSFIGNPKDSIGKKIIGTKRIGKMLVLELEDDLAIGIHLKMSGQIIIQNAKVKSQNHKSKVKIRQINKNINQNHIRVIINFNDHSRFLFIDQRKFGWVKVIQNAKLKMQNLIKELGKEPWNITDKEFFEKLKNKSKAIKVILTDQDVISGVGNIYANDALWEARIDPRREAKTLRQEEIKTLRRALIKVLEKGIKYGGSTGQDGKYVQADGSQGSYQYHFRVYDRKDEKCQRDDGGIINKIKLGGRGTYFCPICQK